MSIPISDNLRQWLTRKNLQGYISIAEAVPHTNAAELLQQIDISKITSKQVRWTLKLKREGFDVVQKMDKDTLRSYFGEYSPSTKAFQTLGEPGRIFPWSGQIHVGGRICHSTLLRHAQEKGRIHHRHIRRRDFRLGVVFSRSVARPIIWVSTKGETDEGHLCPMVVYFVSTLEFGKSSRRKEAITCPETSATGRVAGSRIVTSRYHSTRTGTTTGTELVPESIQNPPPDYVSITPPTEPIQESAPVEQTQTSQRRQRMKEKAERFLQKK